MKRIYLLLISLSTQIVLMAQRGRLMPEDYTDYPDYSSSSSDDTFGGYVALVILIIMGIGILWFKSALKSSRNEEIRSKTLFLTNTEILAYESPTMAINHSSYRTNPKEYYIVEKRVVKIPKYAKCTILEYYPENRSYVKVKFEKYPEPLYIGRWYLRTPKELENGK